MSSAWMMLLAAGALEIVWAIGIKQTDGFTKLWPSVVTIAALWGSFILLSMAVKTLPIGVAYAVWTGIGATGVALIGMTVLGEGLTLAKVGFTAMIVIGIVGLKLSST